MRARVCVRACVCVCVCVCWGKWHWEVGKVQKGAGELILKDFDNKALLRNVDHSAGVRRFSSRKVT